MKLYRRDWIYLVEKLGTFGAVCAVLLVGFGTAAIRGARRQG